MLKGESTRDNTPAFKGLVHNYFKDFDNHFDIVDMLPEVSVQDSSRILSYFILKPKSCGKFTPLNINIKSKKMI